MTSRANLIKQAVRRALPARLMLSGPAGSGKTWSALVIARRLIGDTGRIILIDTETDSALTYADEHTFDHLPWSPPFDPRELAATVHDIGADDTAIVVDSISHFWTGSGGTLDIADGRFGGWKEATPAQDDMIAALLHSRSHIIACSREKQTYTITEVVENGRKKQRVEKVGLAPIQRDGLDYEFNVAMSIDTTHTATVHKTRCRRLAGRSYPPNHVDEFADTYREWLAGGQPLITAEQAQTLRDRAMALPGQAENSPLRKDCLTAFKEQFGAADSVLAEDHEAASALITQFEDLASTAVT